MFNHFPSIQSFHEVRKLVEKYPHLGSGLILYKAKAKLHGTNGGVQVRKNGVFAQSRNQIIGTGDSDKQYFGFPAWVERNRDYFLSKYAGEDFTLFGEWVGPGIMKGTAASKLPHKVFAIFAMQFGASDDPEAVLITAPEALSDLARLPDIHVLPWCGEPIMVDFQSRAAMEAAVEIANKAVAEAETCDPWVKETFGVEGLGEGLVYYPLGSTKRKRFSDLGFKAKGEKHKVVKTKQAVQIDPEVAKSIDEFVTLMVTEPRLEQGLAEVCNGAADKRLIGPFLGWLCQDVEKESGTELAAAGLDWKKVAKPVQTAARTWFLTKAESFD